MSTVMDPPAEGTQDPTEHGTPSADLIVDAGGQLGFDVGGKRPDSSSLRLVGGKVDVEGQFEKGSTVRFEITCRIGEVSFVDTVDSATGQVVGSERRHRARIVSIERAD